MYDKAGRDALVEALAKLFETRASDEAVFADVQMVWENSKSIGEVTNSLGSMTGEFRETSLELDEPELSKFEKWARNWARTVVALIFVAIAMPFLFGIAVFGLTPLVPLTMGIGWVNSHVPMLDNAFFNLPAVVGSLVITLVIDIYVIVAVSPFLPIAWLNRVYRHCVLRLAWIFQEVF